MRNDKDFLGSVSLNRFASDGGRHVVLRGVDFESMGDEKNSYKNDVLGSALQTTQQIPLDWSLFENHTFFNSARVNVNVAFDSIVNGFPFDGTRNEIDSFLDNLTGFERWIFDNFPKNTGSLHFRNCYIDVDDIPGATLQDISRKKDGKPVLDPDKNSISFQFKTFLPKQNNDNQVIVQRISESNGYTLALSNSLSVDNCDLVFYVSSGSSFLNVSCTLNKGEWHDIAAVFNRRPLSNKLLLYVDGKLIGTSERSREFYDFNTQGSKFYIGSGSSHSLFTSVFTPKENLSASIDDFKVFHGNRSDEEILTAVSSSNYQSDNLKLYFKFNEPSGSYSQKRLVIDSSGKGLHSTVKNYIDFNRSNPDGVFKFKERAIDNPVLFPDFQELATFNQNLLLSASNYDELNPNLITRLIPQHYFYEGKLQQGFDIYEEPVVEQYPATGDTQGYSKLGAAQILSSLLYIWAKQFDEIKIFLDHFSKIESYEYDEKNSLADQFLLLQAKNLGIDLPQLFTMPGPTDEDDGSEFGIEPGQSGGLTLQQIQTKIWRRLLASAGQIFKSKGTLSSIKDIIRAFGINPDTSIRLREYGGSRGGIIDARKTMRNVTGKLLKNSGYTITSPFLSGSRIEPGAPQIIGSMTAEGSNYPSDGLYTSSSWTYEATYKFPEGYAWSEESLVRFYVTGSSGESMSLNLIATKSGSRNFGEASLSLYGCTQNIPRNNFKLTIENCTLFDGDRWHISFGRNRKSETQSDVFLRVGKQIAGQITNTYEDVAYVTCSNSTLDIFSNVDSTINSSGSYFRIGQYSSHNSNALLEPSSTPGIDSFNFGGEISSLKFYSKYMSGSEWYEHITNHESLGVKNPLLNFNFSQYESGSFERLRMDASFDQEERNSDGAGNIIIFDYSQNNLHLSGTNFEAGQEVIGTDDVIYSSLDPKYDERAIDNKVRIRSWEDYNNVLASGGEIAPVTEVPRYEQGVDDNRFGIEISIVQGLNEDIIKMFSDFSTLDLAIGDPTNMFDSSYSTFEELREIYFNRLTAPPEYINVIVFCKWFESSIGRLIEQFIPSNTRFLGVNLVVESHMLERHKMKYHWGDIYLGENDRKNLRGNLEVAALETSVRRF